MKSMYSKYIRDLVKDFRTLNHKSFIDKHGASAMLKAFKHSEQMYRINQIDSEVKRKWN